MRYSIQTTKQQQFINITNVVSEAVAKNNVQDGIAVIYVPHTTAAVTINEKTDANIGRDLISALDKVFPVLGEYHHFHGNFHAHIKASVIGSSVTVIIKDGKLMLGTWQGIFFCEFDGPRNRELYIKIMKG